MKIALLPLALLVSTPALASDWEIDHEASEVTFETDVLDSPVTGRFTGFGAAIGFDPDNLGSSYIDATVSVATGETGTPSYTEEMLSEPGLDPDTYPTATFMSETIEASDECGTCYIARGDLILREARLPVELPFRVVIEGDRAVADGTMVIERERFGVGGSSWGEAAAEVTVRVHIEADRAQ